jgi:hypothetical protein
MASQPGYSNLHFYYRKDVEIYLYYLILINSSSECVLKFLHAGDDIHYEIWNFVSCNHLQKPTDASYRFTCFIQWRSMAGVKNNIGRQIQTPVQWNSFISETVRNKKHVHVHFLLRMTDTMISKNIDFSPGIPCICNLWVNLHLRSN